MVALLLEKGHEVVAYDVNAEAVARAAQAGAEGAENIADLVRRLSAPRLVFIMVQRRHVEGVVQELFPLLESGDTVVDGGNTFFEETRARAERARALGLHFIDVGVSGGTVRARTGATLMVGGPREAVARVEQVFRDLAQEGGYGYVGESGAGHFVKMVHNGIEYGMMQALGEGVGALEKARGLFGTDIGTVLSVYNHGSIIEGALTRWAQKAWEEDPGLKKIAGTVPRGDTEEEMEELARLAHMPALETALRERKASRTTPSFAMKMVAALRAQFGSHPTVAAADTAPRAAQDGHHA